MSDPATELPPATETNEDTQTEQTPEGDATATTEAAAEAPATETTTASASTTGQDDSGEPVNNPIVFFDVDISGEYAGRIEITLFADVCPRTCENFIKLCTHENNIKGTKGASDTMIGFRKSIFYHAQKQYCAAGDYTRDNLGSSAFEGERFFPRENTTLKHDAPGLLSMLTFNTKTTAQTPQEASAAPQTQVMTGSMFMIIAQPLPVLDGQQIVFGRVTHGMHVVQRICSECKFEAPQKSGTSKRVSIDECGRLA